MSNSENETWLRVNSVAEILSIGISTVWAKVKTDETFPKPLKVSPRITVWRNSEVREWMQKQYQKEAK